MIILKVTKSRVHPLFRKYIFGKTIRGLKLTPTYPLLSPTSRAFLGLKNQSDHLFKFVENTEISNFPATYIIYIEGSVKNVICLDERISQLSRMFHFTERYSISLRILSKCAKIQTRKTPNTDTFCAVFDKKIHV